MSNRLSIIQEPDIVIDGACSPKVYSFGWPLHARAEDVRACFEKYGHVMQFQLFDSKSKQFQDAFVSYATLEQGRAAVAGMRAVGAVLVMRPREHQQASSVSSTGTAPQNSATSINTRLEFIAVNAEFVESWIESIAVRECRFVGHESLDVAPCELFLYGVPLSLQHDEHELRRSIEALCGVPQRQCRVHKIKKAFEGNELVVMMNFQRWSDLFTVVDALHCRQLCWDYGKSTEVRFRVSVAPNKVEVDALLRRLPIDSRAAVARPIVVSGFPRHLGSHIVENYLRSFGDVAYCATRHATDTEQKAIVRMQTLDGLYRILAINGMQFQDGRTGRISTLTVHEKSDADVQNRPFGTSRGWR